MAQTDPIVVAPLLTALRVAQGAPRTEAEDLFRGREAPQERENNASNSLLFGDRSHPLARGQ